MAKAKQGTTPGAMVPTGGAVPAYLVKTGEGSRGSEDVTLEDLVIPRIDLIQDLSGQVKKNDPLYIPEAEAGMLVNSLTGELYTEVLICPVMYFRQETLWIPRDKGGGFRGAFPTKEEAAAEAKNLDDSTEMISTPQHLVLVVDPKGKIKPAEVVISMPKSKEKISKRFNSLVRISEQDRFARVYTLKSVPEKGAKGNYYNLVVDVAGYPPEDVFRMAEALYKSISEGSRTVAVHTPDEEGTSPVGDDGEY